jgi:peptidoglycan/LPS O-acetylase OafA/YrhL
MRGRLEELDGLRSVAILVVALYHYAYFWTPSGRGEALLPYGDALQSIPVQDLGGVGVSLFFIISGLVISISLHHAGSLGRFAVLRAIRLWPTLLICGTLTYLATQALGPPELQRSPAEAAISMAFLPPEHVGKLLGQPDWQWLDGAYWSLWVEVRFYAVVGLIFFVSRGRLLPGWIAFCVLGALMHIAALGGSAAADATAGLLFAEHQPYFSAGIALALLMRGRTRSPATALLLVAFVQALLYARVGPDWSATRLAAEVAIFALAALAALAPRRIALLGWGPVVLMGQASYVFYLLHQNFGIAILNAIPVTWAGAGIAAMLLVQAGIAVFSVMLFVAIERPLGRRLRKVVPPARRPQERPV